MRFEILSKDNQVLDKTTDIRCIADPETLLCILKAGFKIHINGKQATIKEIIELKKSYMMS